LRFLEQLLYAIVKFRGNNKIQDVLSQLREDKNPEITLNNKARDEQFFNVYVISVSSYVRLLQ